MAPICLSSDAVYTLYAPLYAAVGPEKVWVLQGLFQQDPALSAGLIHDRVDRSRS